MFPRFAAITARGAALALVLTLTTTVAPALASTPRPGIIPTNPIETSPNPLPQPQATAEPMFKPDVRVNYLGKTNGSGGKVSYRFRVQNIGIGTATNVGLGNKIYQLSQDGSVGTLQSGSSGSIASLATDQAQEVTVTCTPLPGSRCDGATLEAYLQGDLNPANNKASS